MEDHEIVELYLERNDKALSESAIKYGVYCKMIACNILHNVEDAEECVNDTWFGAWNAIPPHQPQKLKFFLGRITRNLSFNKFKSKYADKRGNGELPFALDELHYCIPSSSFVEKEVEEAELERKINEFLHSLPERQCNVFLRRYWYVESIKEIANRYAMTQSNVKVNLLRTRNKLKSFLEREDVSL